VLVALLGQPAAQVEDIRLVGVCLPDFAERRRQFNLSLVQQSEVVDEVHRQPSVTLASRTAAALKSGCFETGSQAVTVSSLAARGTSPSWRHAP
jgi:hypothetical protein